MKETAQRVALSTLIVIAIVAVALALWKLKLVLALVFLAFILAAALRPGIERLARAGIPRGFGLLIHYVALIGLIALALWIVVPRAVDQVQSALGGTTQAQIHEEAKHSKGIKHDILTAIDKRLREVPKASNLLHPAVEVTLKVFEVLVGIFFVLALGRLLDLRARAGRRLRRVALTTTEAQEAARHLGPDRPQARRLRARPGDPDRARGTVLSLAFWAIGEPYFILIGAFAGMVEIVPVIGPIAALARSRSESDSTVSWHVALARGDLRARRAAARGLPDRAARARRRRRALPAARLVSVTAVDSSSAGSPSCWRFRSSRSSSPRIDVIVRDVDPAEEDVPTVLFPAKDAEIGCGSEPHSVRARETIAASSSRRRKGLIRCATGLRAQLSSLGG